MLIDMVTPAKLEQLRRLDYKLIQRLAKFYPRAFIPGRYRNKEVALMVRSGHLNSLSGFSKLTQIAQKRGLFQMNLRSKQWRDVDGTVYSHTYAQMCDTEMSPMGTHYWARDSAIAGARLLSSPNPSDVKQGKKILLSALNFMSSQAQLERFEGIIESKDEDFIADRQNWPYIFASAKDNLSTHQTESWSHQQDAWQILAWHILEAIDLGLISIKDLSDSHRYFLGLIAPFLIKVSFWNQENSGSWEELTAVRSSVRAWEHRLIIRLADKSSLDPKFGFLARFFRKKRRFLPEAIRTEDLITAVGVIEPDVIKSMLRDLPFESPNYKKSDPRYRRSDAALIYLLELDYLPFLAQRAGLSKTWAASMERRIIRGVLALQDPLSGGIARYINDTYQASGFFRHESVARLTELYGGPSADASKNFLARGEIIPGEHKAAWTHFVWQLAAWSARRYIETKRRSYLNLHQDTFTAGLKLITGRELSVDVDPNGKSRPIRIIPWRMPECYIAEETRNGREIIFPSPHTPLNWAVAEMRHAFYLRSQLLRHQQNSTG